MLQEVASLNEAYTHLQVFLSLIKSSQVAFNAVCRRTLVVFQSDVKFF